MTAPSPSAWLSDSVSSVTSVSRAARVVGGSAAQRSLLRNILARLGAAGDLQLRVLKAPGGARLTSRQHEIRQVWDVAVVGDAFFEQSAEAGLPRVSGIEAGGVGWPTSNLAGQPASPRATLTSVAATARAMRRIALASGARIAELSVLAPDALAVALRLRVTDPASFLQDRLSTLVRAASTNESRYDGLYIEVDDAHGMAWANAYTPLGGALYVRPSLAGCNPIKHPTPSGYVEPPCPAG